MVTARYRGYKHISEIGLTARTRGVVRDNSSRNTASVNNSMPVNIWKELAEEIVTTAGVLDEQLAGDLIQAFTKVPRDRFIPEEYRSQAHLDVALPIGYGESMPKPSLLARMLGLIGLRRDMVILEIGCGSGYSSAVMAAAGASVLALECQGFLAQRTRHRLDALNFQNILVRRCEGKFGWPEHAPYDAIVVSTAIESIPQELTDQLVAPHISDASSPRKNRAGGFLIAAVGTPSEQVLTLVERKATGTATYKLERCNVEESVTGDRFLSSGSNT